VLLAEHLASFGLTLQRGQIVLTGSLLPLYRVSGGEQIEVSCDTSGTVVGFISRGMEEA
jgi:2-keto-4-pentenoate hydratase